MSNIQKKLFTNIFILVLVNLLIKPFWTFGIDIKVLKIIGAESYGFYYAVFNFTFLFHIFIDIGINQFHNREIARTPEKLMLQYSQLLNLKLFFSFIYIIITFSVAYFYYGYEVLRFKLLLILGVNQIIHSFILYNRANFTALFKFKLDSFFSIFDKLLSIIIVAYIFYLSPIKNSLELDFKLEYFIYAQTFSLLVSLIFSTSILVFKENPKWQKLDLKIFIPYLKKTLPYAIAVLLMALYTRIDAVMIEKLLPETGDYQAGVYAAGYKILDALNQIPYLFGLFIIPVFAKMLKHNENFKPIFFAALKILLSISIGFTIVSLFWGKDILQLLYKDLYRDTWYNSYILLVFSFNTAVLIYTTGGLLTANNNLIAISKMSIVCIVINIVLNYIFILKDGAAGAALATLITQASMAVMQIFLVLKLWKFKFAIKYFLYFFVYTLLLSISSYFLQGNLLNIVIVVFLGIIVALALNLVEWKIFLQNKQLNKSLNSK